MPIPPEPSSGSARTWQILCGVLALVAVVSLVITATNYDNGSQWKSRATKAESLAAQQNVKLTKSEATSTELKKRTVDLAAEKAEAEDTAMVRSLDAEITGTVSSQLDTCSSGIDDLFKEVAKTETVDDLKALSGQADDVYTQCLQASDAAAQLSKYLEDASSS